MKAPTGSGQSPGQANGENKKERGRMEKIKGEWERWGKWEGREGEVGWDGRK